LDTILTNNHTNQACTLIIKHNVSNYLENKKSLGINTLFPDATVALKQTHMEQMQIGRQHWIKGRISINWGALQNFDTKTKETGIRFDTAKKWAMELILLSWEFAHDCQLIRNNKEHNMDGDPETQKNVKLIETILNEAKKWKNGIYNC
jgi:hypothetical protein